MAELGPGAPEFHRQIGKEAVRVGVHALLAVGELSRAYLEGASGIASTQWAPDAAAAVSAAEALVEPGDCVLVKASRAVGLEVVAEALAAVRA
jgi:UDP-N-acetylmuramoyl-tripeptide--D-alanyl-D-alanine ligase